LTTRHFFPHLPNGQITDDIQRRDLTRRIIDMWMARKQQEIAEREGISEEAVRQITQEIPNLEKLGKADKALAEHAVDFDPADL
jgi:hypothetical protein